MDYKDYYKILGVDKKASQDEIKKAYRVLAVKYHPDKNPDNKAAEEQFKLANEANEVLGNPEKRKKYDELGENWHQYEKQGNQQGGNPFGGSQGGFGGGQGGFGGGRPIYVGIEGPLEAVLAGRPLVPSTPMNEERLATAGSSRIFAASACCRSAIAENEIDWDASVTAWIAELSCNGKKPFFTTR